LAHPDCAALTGLLSKEHPNAGFFSQYKNLYMHYIFKKMSERVTFMYGSINAFRKEELAFISPVLTSVKTRHLDRGSRRQAKKIILPQRAGGRPS